MSKSSGQKSPKKKLSHNKRKRIWVVKAGSKMVCEGGPLLIRTWMQQVGALKEKHSIQVIWVTSGAISWATDRTHFNKPKKTLPQKQALSAIGQPLIMDQYNLALQATSQLGAQVLLTSGDMRNSERSLNLKNTMEQLLNWNVIPILNENDAVATEEIKFGDNDSLASQVAAMMGAERLVLMTDVNGLFDKNPKTDPEAKLIEFVPNVTGKHLKMAPLNVKSKEGTGGMHSKLLAAKFALKNSIITHMVRGDWPKNLLTIAEGGHIGTQFGGTK